MFMKVETLSTFKIFTRNVLEIIGAEEVVANEETIAEETVEETVEGLIFSWRFSLMSTILKCFC